MKRITSLALILLVTFGGAFAKGTASKHTTVKGDVVTVTYGKPSKSDGNVLPAVGQPWRTGVDETTIVTLTKGCMFAGRQVNAGTYSLVTIPYKGEWAIMLSREVTDPTNFDYDKIKSRTVLHATAVVTTSDKKVDNFTIEANNDGLALSWDNSTVEITIKPW